MERRRTGSAEYAGAPMPILLRPYRAALLAAPFALAFASGGFFDGARLVALIVAAVLLAIGAVVQRRPLPRSRAGWAALGGLALLTGWVALSHSWAPLPGRAGADAERLLLYLVALAAAAGAWRSREAIRAVEPALVAGTLVVIGYGLAGRLLPGLVHEAHTTYAGGRLEQPLTYWNAEGCLAAIGVALCARLAGDPTRSRGERAFGAVVAVPLLAGAYLSFSRGALAALLGGLIVLVLLAPTWSQLRGAALVLEAGVAGAIACGLSPGVRGLAGSLGHREAEGALVLLVLLGLMALAGAVQLRACRVEAEERIRLGPLPLPRWSRVAAVVAIAGVLLGPAIAARTSEAPAGGPAFGATNTRLSSVGSNRYQYWKVAVRTFAHHPLAGVGTGGFAVQWLEHRTIDESVRDAHSLELETLAELGLIGFAFLALMLGGVAACGRIVKRADPRLAAGACAGLAVWALHSAIDWDWEMPAVTLVAVLLAGALISGAELGHERSLAPRRGEAVDAEEEDGLRDRLAEAALVAPEEEPQEQGGAAGEGEWGDGWADELAWTDAWDEPADVVGAEGERDDHAEDPAGHEPVEAPQDEPRQG
jgi:O-Antigen ligase